jgi:hypothetical protein
MLLKPEEKMYLLNRLPALELSYEPKLHKKVYAPAYYIIPKGPKALIWYTYWHEQNVCLLIKLNERGNYSDVQLFPTTFSDDLALGTIIYGTYFIYTNRNYFTAEQLYYYKGLPVNKKPYNVCLNLLLELFTTHISQVAYTADSLVVGLPVLTETYEEALAQEVPYQTYGIAAVRNDVAHNVHAAPYVPPRATHAATTFATAAHATTTHATTHTNAFAHKAVFKVRADLAADNYHLYTAEDIFYETAMVPTYKCSVMMNALFRNIKENANLDLLEESDEEGEFENTQIDKFVDLAKTVLVECIYSKRFKKWQPVKSLSHAKIITFKELQHFNSKK